MKKMSFILSAALAIVAIGMAVFAAEGSSSPYTDAAGDIQPGIATAGGTLDILGMEVSHDATNINLKLTVNGVLPPGVGGVDWGKFMIGIATGKTEGTLEGNGWGRPINLSTNNDPFGAQLVGMDYWIGSWVDNGGGSQLWTYTSGSWSGPVPLPGFSFTSGPSSDILYSVSRASLGLTGDTDSFYFDAYSSGGGGGDSAIDSLANPNISVTDWGGPYTSYLTSAGGPGLNVYTIPEPSSVAMAAAAAVSGGLLFRRRKRQV